MPVAVLAVVVPVVVLAVAVFAVVVAVDGVTLAEDGPGGEDEVGPAEEVDDEADAEPLLAEDDGPDGEAEELEAEADPVEGPVEPEVEPELAPEDEAEPEPDVLAEVEPEVEPDIEADGEAGFIGAAGGIPGASSFGGWTGRSTTLICPVTRANQPPVEMFTMTNSLTGFGAGTTTTSVDGWKPVQDLPVYLALLTSAGGVSGLPQLQRTRGTPWESTRTEVPACSTDW